MMTLVIDDQTLQTNAGDTLLQACLKAGINLPHLCANPGADESGQTHHLCTVAIASEDGWQYRHACSTPVSDGLTVVTQSQTLSNMRQQALQLILNDHFADCEAPCQQACPAGVDVQSYLYHMAQGDHQQAVKVIKQTLPMPLSIGRVCPAFCESECRRSLVDEPLAIRQLKRHAADIDLDSEQPWMPERAADTGKKVAIIGAGPAGLSAGYFLSNQGHDVTLFEAMPKAGGWLRYGIPEYRLPKAILDKEIELMCANGLKIETHTRLGQHIQLQELVADFDAVCLAIGAQKAVAMDYPGADLAGCYLGVDYLKDFCTEQTLVTGNKVAVIGGGNTAIDCARTAVRTGADVTLIYRRTRADMPAEPYEIHEAEVEGVKFHFLTNPLENLSDDHGRVKAITLSKMALTEPDASGRRSPKATGETFTEDFDTVIAAVSQTPDMDFLSQPQNQLSNGKLALTRWNTFAGCEHTMSAGIEKLFVIGDSRRGPATAVAAIGDGRRASEAIHKQLTTGLVCDLVQQPFNATKGKLSNPQLDPSLYANVAKHERFKMAELSRQARQGNFDEVELGFSNDHALQEAARCLECACQANTQCSLRDYATEYKVDSSSLDTQDCQRFMVDKSAAFIQFDANRCISCGACVDMCQRQSGHHAICFEPNSFSAVPNDNGALLRRAPRAGFSARMADSQCVQCGNCVQVCPTGALTDARDKSQARTTQLDTVSTICTYCGVGCRLNMHVDRANNTIKHVVGDSESQVNEGMLCVKGRFGFDFIGSEQRLTTPLIRRNGQLEPASWEQAISLIAKRFSDIKAVHGAKSIAALSSAKATNEENYLLQKFVRAVLGSNNIDHCARLCHASTVSALNANLGSGAMTNDIQGIKHADLIFILGSDTESAHPIIASRIKEAVNYHQARLVVADPKKVSIADKAELYISHKPGTDVMLLNAIMQQILIHHWHDTAYIEQRTEGFELLKTELMKADYSLAMAAKITGVSADDIATLARMLGTATKTAVFYAMGITQHTSGHDNVTAIANLQLLLGNIGIKGAGINPLRGQSNVQGACDMGALPDYLPGYRRYHDSENLARLSDLWQAPLSTEVGIAATHMMKALAHGQLKALYIMGENPVLSDPDQAHVIQGLAAAEFVVVQDIFLTETAAYADVVLPAAAFAEKRGHFTNTERRVQQLQQAVNPPGQALPDWRIIQAIANAMGANWQYDSEETLWSEAIKATPQYRGIYWDRLRPIDKVAKQGLQWPCINASDPGTAILHQDCFIRGKAKLEPVSYRLPAELPCDDYPLILSTGRLLEQFHTGTLTRKTAGLDMLASPKVMISVYDAEQYGIENGDSLELSTRRGTITIDAFVSKRAQVGVLFLPFHFAEAAANKLTINALDPVAQIPEFKICAVNLRKLATV
ncbi:formate dehydrogenase subunit alpha [Shewanella sp. NIFS-20-20]|uniref:formate dehydrogenase subunit alpha n=1 Tax=Shewanella sp. NIFS-20-20 TaxID=2853806 RepID=UPI001C489114|nr:formate dehydrogenase subunit alpha [Shewanella sp. NIFS-20-20]MBV7314730.1 formate dehydrogenase subunit alpha [Shewanella sp. NIFS-20-20]